MNKEQLIVAALRNLIVDREAFVKGVHEFEKTGNASTHLYDVEAVLKDTERRVLEILVRP